MSYRTRLLLGICLLVVLTGAVVTFLAYRSARSSTAGLARSLFREVSAHTVTNTQAFVLRAAPIAQSLKELADNTLTLDDSDQLANQLLAFLKANEGVSWISYGDRYGTFTGAFRPAPGDLRINQSRIVDGKTHLEEHAVADDGARNLLRKEQDTKYDPRQRPYYLKAQQAGKVAWTAPYVFFEQGIPGISCVAPVYDKAGALQGVLSVDFDLNALSDFVSKLSVGENGRVFLFTVDELLLADPSGRLPTTTGHGGQGQLLTLEGSKNPLLSALRGKFRPKTPDAQQEDPFQFFTLRQNGTDYFASTTTFPVGDDQTWVVGAVAPQDDFLASVWRSQRLALGVAAGAVVLAGLMAVLMARRVSGPVLSLVQFMRRVGAGDLDAQADFRGGTEFQQLSHALNKMIHDLRDRMRLRHSLDVAMEVQQRLLPQQPPSVRKLDIAGHSTYCDETGGDYYDFLIVDDADPDTVLVALGDVMGHGVAAALVMAGARAVLRDRAAASGSLAELMTRLNGLLAADLEGTRFMTMHLSAINGHNGSFRFVSAGHDPAIVFDPGSDAFEETDAGDLPLGVSDDAQYEEHVYGPLRAGQIVFIGTDGVWECPNAEGELFGKPRLHAVMRQTADRCAAEIAQAVIDRLAAFRGPARQVDDVTFIIVKVLS